jgi:hypothetical protein
MRPIEEPNDVHVKLLTVVAMGSSLLLSSRPIVSPHSYIFASLPVCNIN